MSSTRTIRIAPACTTSSRTSAAPMRRQWWLIVLLGTLVPLLTLAGLYLLAPMPLTAAAVQTLRRANQFVAVIVLLNWVVFFGVVANRWVFGLLRERLSGLFSSNGRVTA